MIDTSTCCIAQVIGLIEVYYYLPNHLFFTYSVTLLGKNLFQIFIPLSSLSRPYVILQIVTTSILWTSLPTYASSIN